MKLKDIISMENGNGVAKLKVYANDLEGCDYETFISPEAYNAIQEWLEFRASYGEKIGPESYIGETCGKLPMFHVVQSGD